MGASRIWHPPGGQGGSSRTPAPIGHLHGHSPWPCAFSRCRTRSRGSSRAPCSGFLLPGTAAGSPCTHGAGTPPAASPRAPRRGAAAAPGVPRLCRVSPVSPRSAEGRAPMERGNACAPHPGAAPKVLRMEKSNHGQSAERDLPKLTVDSGLREQEPKRKESWMRRGKLFLWAVNQHGKIGGGEFFWGGESPAPARPLAEA